MGSEMCIRDSHNPVFRTMLNYVYSDMGGGGAEAMHSFMMRWQIGM